MTESGTVHFKQFLSTVLRFLALHKWCEEKELSKDTYFYRIALYSKDYWTYVEYDSSCCHEDLLTSSALLSPRLGGDSGLSMSGSAPVLAEGEGEAVWMGEGMGGSNTDLLGL